MSQQQTNNSNETSVVNTPTYWRTTPTTQGVVIQHPVTDVTAPPTAPTNIIMDLTSLSNNNKYEAIKSDGETFVNEYE